jgi:5-(carboxyamino)imidazole ribonucleotide synthase
MHIGKTLGIIGGGQLGKMMILPASLLGFKTFVYSNEENSPATFFANKSVIGRYDDLENLLKFASECDFITIEFEGIKAFVLNEIERLHPNKLKPNANSVFITQNRLREKNFIKDLGIQTTTFSSISNINEAKEFFNKNGKFILKTTENGYDGKGQFMIKSTEDLLSKEIPFEREELIGEGFINFGFESSCILTREKNGRVIWYPLPINEHKDGILQSSSVNLNTPVPSSDKMIKASTQIAEALNFIGSMAVEFFCMKNGEILVNEIAPRPHNSGHFTMDLCTVSQFENHVRAVCDLTILPSKLLYNGKMVNLIGNEIFSVIKDIDKPNAKLHLYGKESVKEKRKMGHITYIYDEVFS